MDCSGESMLYGALTGFCVAIHPDNPIFSSLDRVEVFLPY